MLKTFIVDTKSGCPLNIRNEIFNPKKPHNNMPIGMLKNKELVVIDKIEMVYDDTFRKEIPWGRICQEYKKTKAQEEWICLYYCSLIPDNNVGGI